VTTSDGPVMVGLECVVQHTREGAGNVEVPAKKLGKPLEDFHFAPIGIAGYDANISPLPPGGDGDPPHSENPNLPWTFGISGPISLAGAFAAYLQSNCSGERYVGGRFLRTVSQAQVTRDGP